VISLERFTIFIEKLLKTLKKNYNTMSIKIIYFNNYYLDKIKKFNAVKKKIYPSLIFRDFPRLISIYSSNSRLIIGKWRVTNNYTCGVKQLLPYVRQYSNFTIFGRTELNISTNLYETTKLDIITDSLILFPEANGQ